MIILIADDDKLVRLSIKSMLCDIFQDDCIIVEAKNGRALVEKCSDRHPDLAFVDIDMPYLDGLTGISQCKDESPNTQFVILTGHSDFSYAQKSISLGVVDYALKPLEMDYLIDLIDKLQKRRSCSLTAQNSDFQAFIANLFQLMDEGVQNIISPDKFNGNYLGFLIYIKTNPNFKSYTKIYHALYKLLNSYGGRLVEKRVHFAISNSNISAIRFLIHSNSNIHVHSIKQQITKIINSISIESIGISAKYVCNEDVINLYNILYATESLAYDSLIIPDKVIVDSSKLHRDDCTAGFLKDLINFTNCFLELNPRQLREAVDNLNQTYKKTELSIDYRILSTNISKLTGYSISANSFDSFIKAMERLENHSTEIPVKNYDKIDQIVDYIYKNYKYDIGINQLAEKFELTPNYLSKLFHDKTGEKFIDFLTHVRIEQAKILLKRNSSALVKDIALMVGYVSARHFSTVFKKLTGVLPAEFRDTEDYHCNL